MQNDIEYSSQNQELYRLMASDKTLAYTKTAVQNNRVVLEKILDSPEFNRRAEIKSLIHDVMVESYQVESMVDEGMRIKEQLSGIFSNVISNNLNNVMKMLTSVSVVLTVPTIIGGLWGMNVPVPLAHSAWGFVIINGMIILISVLLLRWLKDKAYL